jgi:HAD superfamily hydrolase (TIGR01456 family)
VKEEHGSIPKAEVKTPMTDHSTTKNVEALKDSRITVISKKLIKSVKPSENATAELTRLAKRARVHTPGSDYGFSFDIDGVIHKSGELCPGAKEAMECLNDKKIPFIFLTNGGGKNEEARAADMAEKLGIPVHADQFIQAHTPFKQHVSELADRAVLVLGGVGDGNREVAEFYGYNKVITNADLVTAHNGVFAFDEMHGDYFKNTAQPLPLTTEDDGTVGPVQIAAIFIYSSPRDWGLDLQIIIDLLLSEKGKFGTTSPLNNTPNLPNKGYLQDSQPKIYFANPDITFATKYPLPRICQGTFKLALEGMWKGLTETELISGEHYTQIGKPTQLQFEYGERALRDFSGKDLKKVYMVGDGPRSDIAGANNYDSPFGSTWESILVQTGIHQAGSTPEHVPTVEVGNVLDAVRWALKKELIEI